MIRMRFNLFIAIVLMASLAGCATNGNTHWTQIGCGAGAIIGAAAGYAIGGDVKGAVIGAGAGTAVGCMAGSMWQQHQRELKQIAQQENLRLQMETLYSTDSAQNRSIKNEAGFIANIQATEMFAINSAKLTPSGERQIRKMARALSRNSKTQYSAPTFFMIVGHTDATGSAKYNQRLSERRARTVGKILVAAGVNPRHVYYQGAGASRPLGDNTTIAGRAKNRRVEIVEVQNKELLMQTIKKEHTNIKYLAHGTRTSKTPRLSDSKNSSTVQSSVIKSHYTHKFNGIDFGGDRIETVQWNPAVLIKPKSSGLQIISSAEANDIPVKSCFEDSARITGEVKNLATGSSINSHKTRDYLPGMNGRAWANLVNGNLVILSPVSVLKEDAKVVRNPLIQVVKDYDKGKRRTSANLKAIANTYEGEKTILYRVFVNRNKAPLSCMDIVMSKIGGKSIGGKLYYKNKNKIFVATFKPKKT